MADSHNIVIFASLDMQKFQDPESEVLNLQNTGLPYINNAPVTLSYTVSSIPFNIDDAAFYYSSNGITGLVNPLTAFNIPKINFATQNIYFVAKVITLSGVPVKSFEKIQDEVLLLETQSGDDIGVQNGNPLDGINVGGGKLGLELFNSVGEKIPPVSANFQSKFDDLTANDAGGYFKGFLNTPVVGDDMRIRLTYITDSGVLSGFSRPFDIYPSSGLFDIRKVNEDNNEERNFEDLTYQPALQFQPLLMKELIGQIVGRKSSLPETLGIKTYEKVSNFTSNIADPDIANVKSLKSLIRELNIDFDEYNQQFPPSLSRLIDILSVSLSRQLGGKNQYQLNFDDKGFTSKTVYGKNKGAKLNIENTVLNTGEQSRDILAYEKFSEKYSIVNTNVISATNVEYLSTNAYPLSAYNNSWGWGLVIPSTVTGIDIEKYYEFYDFNKTIDGTYTQKFIDFDNENNTYLTNITSFKQYNEKWGVAENIISHNLYTNLGFISGYTV